MRRAAQIVALAIAPLAGAQVELRGGEFVQDTVVSVSPAGVEVEREGVFRTLGWHQVKRVEGDLKGEAERFARLSIDLWRATSRLDRGDVTLAAPLFEEFWAAARANADRAEPDRGSVALRGPTGLAIAQGVADVRVAQGRLAEAVEPWAVAIALRRSLTGGADAMALLDPGLPPIFLPSIATERLARAEPPEVVSNDPVALALFATYRMAAANAMGEAPPVLPIDDSAANIPDVRFALDVAAMQAGVSDDAPARDRRLRDAIGAHAGEWREAWARVALGAGAVRTRTGVERLRGALEALHVPARLSSGNGYLAGVALALASIALDENGEPARAEALRAILEATYPEHPANAWLARRAVEGGAL